MKALILAAGEGRRMRPLTLTTPKPLLTIAGRPIIERALEALPSEVSEVVVVVKYLADQIKSYLGVEFKGRKVAFAEGSDQGTAHSFLAAREHFSARGRFLFLYGDELPNPQDIKNCLAHDLGVLVFEPRHPQANGIVSLNEDGTIGAVTEKPESVVAGSLAADGVMVLNGAIFNYRPQPHASGEYYFTSLLNQFVKDHQVVPVMSVGIISDITTPADLERVGKLVP